MKKLFSSSSWIFFSLLSLPHAILALVLYGFSVVFALVLTSTRAFDPSGDSKTLPGE